MLMLRLPWACLGFCGGKGGANDADDALALGVPRPCGGNVGANDADGGTPKALWQKTGLMMLMMRLPWAWQGLVEGREAEMMLMMRLPWACLGFCGGKGGSTDADAAPALGVPRPCGRKRG